MSVVSTISEPKTFSIPSVQRLPVYLRFLEERRKNGETVVSCTRIAEEFGQLSVQVRKDLAITGAIGRPKVGYQVDDLIDAIEIFLGWDRSITAFLVGTGSLGSAILGYDGFTAHGLKIVAAFDVDPTKIGQTIRHCPVFSLGRLPEMAEKHAVKIGIITVPAEAAQNVAERLTDIGIKGIWNYTPARLELPPDVVCEDVKLSASLAVLTNRLKNVL
ncbi:MAG: redox-sensing transcriptional repressor Rex [Thermoguttaceae bacterium]